MFVARDKEPAALSRMYEKLGFQMAVVYGRRCVRNRGGEKHCRPISESNANPSAFSGFSVRMPRGIAVSRVRVRSMVGHGSKNA